MFIFPAQPPWNHRGGVAYLFCFGIFSAGFSQIVEGYFIFPYRKDFHNSDLEAMSVLDFYVEWEYSSAVCLSLIKLGRGSQVKLNTA